MPSRWPMPSENWPARLRGTSCRPTRSISSSTRLLRDPVRLRERQQVVARRATGVDGARLEQRADLVQRRRGRGRACRSRSTSPAVGRSRPRIEPHGGRLPGAVRAEEAGDEPRPDREAQAVDRALRRRSPSSAPGPRSRRQHVSRPDERRGRSTNIYLCYRGIRCEQHMAEPAEELLDRLCALRRRAATPLGAARGAVGADGRAARARPPRAPPAPDCRSARRPRELGLAPNTVSTLVGPLTRERRARAHGGRRATGAPRASSSRPAVRRRVEAWRDRRTEALRRGARRPLDPSRAASDRRGALPVLARLAAELDGPANDHAAVECLEGVGQHFGETRRRRRRRPDGRPRARCSASSARTAPARPRSIRLTNTLLPLQEGTFAGVRPRRPCASRWRSGASSATCRSSSRSRRR